MCARPRVCGCVFNLVLYVKTVISTVCGDLSPSSFQQYSSALHPQALWRGRRERKEIARWVTGLRLFVAVRVQALARGILTRRNLLRKRLNQLQRVRRALGLIASVATGVGAGNLSIRVYACAIISCASSTQEEAALTLQCRWRMSRAIMERKQRHTALIMKRKRHQAMLTVALPLQARVCLYAVYYSYISRF